MAEGEARRRRRSRRSDKSSRRKVSRFREQVNWFLLALLIGVPAIVLVLYALHTF